MDKFATILYFMAAILLLDVPVMASSAEIFHTLRNSNGRIINGQKDVPITDRPFQVHICSFEVRPSNSCWGCGGSLVHPNWVLTAGHCVTNKEGVKYPEFRVRAGSNDKSLGFEQRDGFSKDITTHPDWDGSTKAYGADLALVYISNPFQLSNKIQTIQMNEHASNLEGKIATISGWGVTEVGKTDKLSKTDITIERDTLDRYNNHIILMTNSQGTGACRGDSGGPATVIDEGGNALLVGVASYTKGTCGPDAKDSAYVDIYNYMDWIKQTIGEDSVQTPTGPSETTPKDVSSCGSKCNLLSGVCKSVENPKVTVEKDGCGTLNVCYPGCWPVCDGTNQRAYCTGGDTPTDSPPDPTPSSQCRSDQWLCDNGIECIPNSYLCDNYEGGPDCRDGSDESDKHCSKGVRSEIDNLLKEKKVLLISLSYCVPCKRVKMVLAGYNIPKENIEILDIDKRLNDEDRAELVQYMMELTGARTFPRVFIGGKFIGGSSDTLDLDNNGQLEPLLKSVGALP